MERKKRTGNILILGLIRIADMFRDGIFVDKNEQEAFRIYSHCCEIMESDYEFDNEEDVCLRLVSCYLNGIGTEVDVRAALEMYKKAENKILEKMEDDAVRYVDKFNEAVQNQDEARKKLINSMDCVSCAE